MFIKPFRVKSQTQVKGSERKKLRAEIANNYPSLSPEQLSDLIPPKADLILVRIYCYKGESVHVYQVEKEPLFFTFEKEKIIYPSIYTLWRFPSLVKAFTTHPPVIRNLANGAHLMLPGIIINVEEGPAMYGKFPKGTIVAVNTTATMAPQAIGITAHCSMDMYMAARHGKGVTVLHVFGDYLWQMGNKTPPPEIPHPLGDFDDVNTNGNDVGLSDATACDQLEENGLTDTLNELSVEDSDIQDEEEASALISDVGLPKLAHPPPTYSETEMVDHLLVHCLLKAVKTSLKKVELPILTSNLYAQHMIPACPDHRTLEIKKSSFKKLTKFLGAMCLRGLIEVKEYPKGIENLTGIKFNHEDVKNFIVDKEETTVKPVTSNANAFIPPVIEELYQVSGTTIDFFRANKLCKGDVLSSSDIRKIVTDYVNKEKLKVGTSSLVNLNPILHQAVVAPKEGFKETLRWDEIFSRLLGRMSQATRITRHGQAPIVRKGKLEPLQLEVAKRTGNKKVTLIYNAYIYGIDEHEFAHQIQVGVAASTSVGPAEHKPQGTTQVLVQGSQVSFVARLLLETYKVPRKYIKGLELAAKEKKLKR